MFHRKGRLLASAVATASVMLVAIGGTASTSGASSSGEHTLTIGVLTDVTGLGATNASTIPLGVKAAIGELAAKAGYKITYDVADTTTSPSVALSAAQKLVEQDHVFAVIANSAITFSAAPYLASQGVPVVGAAIDSTEWITDRNMFSVIGTENYTKVYSQWGTIYKKLGVTNLASLGYSISPSSAGAANGVAKSVELAGIKVGYLNASFPFGSTNVAPVALALKSAGVNGLSASIETSTEFALINQLKDEGVNLKVLNATGYGGDLFLGGSGGTKTAQNEYFLTSFEPVELHTAATEQLVNAMKTYAGVKSEPTFAEYQGYLSVEALLDGLKAAGSNPTQASFINAMLKMGTFNGGGLYGPGHSVGFALDDRGQVSGADNCAYILKFSGSTFHLVSGLDPICGKTIPGQSVAD